MPPPTPDLIDRPATTTGPSAARSSVTSSLAATGGLAPNYPLNTWWVAALSNEVTRQPLGLWLLDKPVVLYRREDGGIVALDDRCPHRSAPLSAGRVHGDDLACPYHGFRFDATGQCVHIPTQAQIPTRLMVRAYDVIEDGPLVWIWLGDPALAAQATPPDTRWLGDPAWSTIHGSMEVEANYQLLKENVLDLTHIPHIHPVSIGANDWTRPPVVTTDGGSVTYTLEFPAAPLPPVYGVPTGIGMHKPATRKNWGTSFTPAYHQGWVEVVDPQPAPGARSTFLFSVCHLTTPISPTRFRYTYFMGWDIALSDDYLAAMRANVPKGYQEDKVILEAVQQRILRDPRGMDYPEVIVQADQAAIQSRRKLEALLAKERDAG